MKKVRFTISDFMYEILKSDSEYFKIPIGKIGNIIFNYYIDKNLNKIELEESTGEVIQFNLNKSNEEIFMDTLIRNKIQVEAQYWRNIFFTYINNLRYKREEILFQKIFRNIKKALKSENKIKVKYHDHIRLISPYFIKISDSESRSYLFCYCEKNQDYRNYKVSEIEEIWFTNEKIEIKDKKYIEEVYKKFDPFLSYRNKVKIKFTDKGLELYKNILINRPKVLKQEENIYTFECDYKLALIYFSQFFSLVEILEPKELREKLEKELENTLKIYKNKGDNNV